MRFYVHNGNQPLLHIDIMMIFRDKLLWMNQPAKWGACAVAAFRCRTVLLCMAVVLLAGCNSPRLMPRPKIFVNTPDGSTPFDAIPEVFRTPEMRILFATDRFPEQLSANQPIRFGANRSSHLYVGYCRVQVGEVLTWDELVELSMSDRRTSASRMRVSEPDVLLRYPGTFWRSSRIDDPSLDENEFRQRRMAARARLHQLVDRQLELTNRREAIIYIHGYNVTFNSAVATMANLWHFMGRQGVPIVYTWPAGAGGLTGYTTDSESGEFTIFHLKMFLEDLAAHPNLDAISILAHSRGTDVTLTAIRELGISARAAGHNPREALKLRDVVLASPDIDMEVASQRISSEEIPRMMEHMTIYSSPFDRALLLSRWLHRSVSRIGIMNTGMMAADNLQTLTYFPNLDFIETRVRTDFVGHGYFYNNPSVSADVILLIGGERNIGAAHGRPLIAVGSGVWRLEEGYPNSPETLVESLVGDVRALVPPLW